MIYIVYIVKQENTEDMISSKATQNFILVHDAVRNCYVLPRNYFEIVNAHVFEDS